MTANIFVYLVNYAKSNMIRPQSGSYLEELKKAGASIQCTFEESDRTTQFIADTVFDEGEEEKVS